MSLKVGYLRTCILMPFFILILLVSSVYGIYMFYYVLPNLTDFYWYDRPQNTITQSDQSIYPIFKEILKLESHFMSLIPSFEFSKKIIPNNEFNFKQNNIKNEVSISESHYKRGLILFIFIHYFLFWFIFSTIKTIITKPGSVSYEWTVKIEEKLNDCYEEQKFLLKLKKENLKNKKENSKNNGEEPNVSSNNGGEETEKEDEIVQAENNLKKDALSPEERKNQNKIENKDLNNFKTNEQGIQGANSEKSITFQENEYDDEFTESENAVINQVALAMVMEKENSRFCRHCRTFKPLRTHHCRQCSTCVLKMDHHCQWVLNCIGFKNYKYFMNLLIYANLCLFFFVITFTRCVVDVSMNSAVDSFTIYIILLNYLLNLVMLCIIFSFTCFHLWLIFTGKTTIEYCEKNNKDKEFKKTNICFNRGYVNNFISVFNKNPLLWFFPFNPNTEGDGLYEGINESEENLKLQDTI